MDALRVSRDFADFGGLLAAIAAAGLVGRDVADVAEIDHFVKLAVANGEETIHLESVGTFPSPLKLELAAQIGRASCRERV